MINENQIAEEIDNYLNDRMSLQERLAFEDKMASDVFLAEKVNEAKYTNEAIYFASLAMLKEEIGRDIKQIKYKPKAKINKTFLLSILIIALGSISILFIMAVKDKKVTTERNAEAKDKITGESKKQNPDNNVTDNSKPRIDKPLITENEKTVAAPNNQERTTISSKPEEHLKSDSAVAINKIENDEPENEDLLPIKEDNSKTDVKDYKNSATPDNTVNCNKTFEFKTNPSCKHQATGTIAVIPNTAEISGVEINNKTYYNGDAIKLAAGQHLVVVNYGKECHFTRNVTIEEKWCPLNTSYSFNPDFGEKWEIRYGEGDHGNYVILDSFGKEIYSNTFGSGSEYWDGSNKYGNIVPLGTYIAILSYSDGRKEKVELTIVR